MPYGHIQTAKFTKFTLVTVLRVGAFAVKVH